MSEEELLKQQEELFKASRERYEQSMLQSASVGGSSSSGLNPGSTGSN
jgi:hypothetical protein